VSAMPKDAATETAPPESRIKNILLFFAAPFISLAYAAALPMAALRLLKQARQEEAARKQPPSGAGT
jgi:hypothetical protein